MARKIRMKAYSDDGEVQQVLPETIAEQVICDDKDGSKIRLPELLNRYTAAADFVLEEATSAVTLAANSAETARESADTAIQAAEQANTDAEIASNAAQIAGAVQTAALNIHAEIHADKLEVLEARNETEGFRNEADNSAILSKSWAVGDTGARTGEDVDNAKYWANRAKQSSDLGYHVETFVESESGVHGIRYYNGYLQCMENGEWVDASSSGAREGIIIGTATSGHTARDCDFLCTGENDQNVISQALNALENSDSGSLYLLEGEYILTAPVTINLPLLRIIGAGQNTIIKRNFQSEYLSGTEIAGGMLRTGENCKDLILSDFTINGNMDNFASMSNGAVSSLYTGRVTLTRMTLITCGSGVTVMGYIHATDCTFNEAYYTYAPLGGVLTNNTFQYGNHAITNCTAVNNQFFASALVLKGNCKVSGNSFQDMTKNAAMNISAETYLFCSGNTIRNCKYAIYGALITGGVITENIMQDNDMAVWLINSQLCNVQGNTIYRGTGKATDYAAGQYTVFLYNSTNCTVWNNVLLGKDAVDMTEDPSNVISNNRVTNEISSTFATKEEVDSLGTVYVVSSDTDLTNYNGNDLVIAITNRD